MGCQARSAAGFDDVSRIKTANGTTLPFPVYDVPGRKLLRSRLLSALSQKFASLVDYSSSGGYSGPEVRFEETFRYQALLVF
jgi:hypothetical protein